jgi:dTDP-4-amino-4,6-dideoxygalactose transaminase
MFKTIDDFEKIIADWFGAKYAVATDSCTHAIELCFILKKIKFTSCPINTYVSVPMTLKKLNIEWQWKVERWHDYYHFDNTNIIDSAVLWRKNSYIPQTMMCLSFQYKKHLSLGRGGMILLDNEQEYTSLIKMAHDGRIRGESWVNQNIDTMGYHYYMTPETAQEGIKKFNVVKDQIPNNWSYENYPDLSKMELFKNVK